MPCRPGISSMSLGRAWEHDLTKKLTVASKAGFQGIEIFYEDLAYLASTYSLKKESQPGESPSQEDLFQAAERISTWCHELQIEVICLQPFMSYEGLTDAAEHRAKIDKLKVWFELCKKLDTDLILVPSTFQNSGTTGDTQTIIKDMVEIADLGAQESPPIRFAYENLAWGTHIDTWEQVYDIVRRVDRPNFGMCVDTFNICGRIWADPTTSSRKTPKADDDLHDSMMRLVSTVDPMKIFYVQVIDAERMKEPLIDGHPWHQEDQPARMSWSRNARLFPYEDEGYLPVDKVMRAVFDGLRWEGWVSMELFSRTMGMKDETVPEWHAARGIRSWHRVKEEFQL